MLLNFTREEEDMLKQTLEYKVGGFFAKRHLYKSLWENLSGLSHWTEGLETWQLPPCPLYSLW